MDNKIEKILKQMEIEDENDKNDPAFNQKGSEVHRENEAQSRITEL
jgi:hypothetical protein